ncbi:four-carbon acid sugar kinase family protein [Actinopolymorpha pittospori]|uniref:4-hydroxythreonine-4-phosphate dehydrogenase n=1 Tax=Actinopolymorpha pittospori TaxID=648752 RepID=A0A927MQU4_9ACTN|nr:four-carbon acid sugar kinase family protein [Actinopolymorpha pittospori]MBE1605196.1 4-hydroxythreonine-4-phosphate dehydrogenase [Actinopolymorpha pittospori]
MRATVAVVADDLTGAADTGVGFLRAGLATSVAWADPALDPDLAEHADVLAVDTRTRAADPGRAEQITREVVTTLREIGVRTLYKKADSTLRGHVGIEVKAALTGWHPASVAVVALAFPGTGRTTVDGRQRVGGIPLAMPPIPTILEGAGIATARANLAVVRGPALTEAFQAHRRAGARALVCDAETDADLQAIARAGSTLGAGVVWVGSGGLAPVLSANLGLTGAESPGHVGATGPVLVTVGSASDIARAQAADLVAAGATHLSVPIAALDGTDDAAGAAFAKEVQDHLRRATDVVLTLGAEIGAGGPDDDRLAVRLGELLRPCATLVGGLVVTGGDTATGVLQAWRTNALRLVEEVEPGVPLSITVAPRPIPVVTKAGGFGNASTLTLARARLTALLNSEGE